MSIKKIFFVTLGLIGLALGAVGAVVPLLPAFPFLMLAAVSFAHNSERLHSWFRGTRLYKDNLESYVRGKALTWKAKIRLLIVLTLSMGIGFFMMRRIPIGQIVLSVVWIGHVIYFLFGIKTIPEQALKREMSFFDEKKR